ncbi:hypothetical protein N431DRAFT_493557 [Stipitochalara longipes BDJ]|nr:hypothetical protein N431DRAFT_493557 [Stipitochalara longipes BDJ]
MANKAFNVKHRNFTRRTITITSSDFTNRDNKGWPVRNNRLSHNAQNLAFGPQLHVLFMENELAVKSFFGGHSQFEGSGIIGDFKEKVRHMVIGRYLCCGKIWNQLARLDSLETLTLERSKREDWSLEMMVENLKNKWLSRIEKNNINNQGQSAGMPEITWLTEVKLRQKSDREREPRPKSSKKISLPLAPYRGPTLRSQYVGFYYVD